MAGRDRCGWARPPLFCLQAWRTTPATAGGYGRVEIPDTREIGLASPIRCNLLVVPYRICLRHSSADADPTAPRRPRRHTHRRSPHRSRIRPVPCVCAMVQIRAAHVYSHTLGRNEDRFACPARQAGRAGRLVVPDRRRGRSIYGAAPGVSVHACQADAVRPVPAGAGPASAKFPPAGHGQIRLRAILRFRTPRRLRPRRCPPAVEPAL